MVLDCCLTASCILFYFIPFSGLFSLPAVYIFSGEQYFLRVSFCFGIQQTLLGLIHLISQKNRVSNLFVKYLQYPSFFLINIPTYWFVNSEILEIYKHFLEILAPVLLVFQAYQVVHLIIDFSQGMVNRMNEDENSEFFYKSLILSLSALSYLVAFTLTYYLYTTDQITIFISSWIATTITICLILTFLIASFIENGIISDIAFLTLFEIFIIRSALKESEFRSKIGIEIFSSENILDIDFLITCALTILSLLTLIIPTSTNPKSKHKKNDDEEDDDEDEEKSLFLNILENFGSSLSIFFLTYFLLSSTGHISPSGIGIRVFQTGVALSVYLYNILREDEDRLNDF